MRRVVANAIAKAKAMRQEFDEPINWEDLQCTRIVHWMDDLGDDGFIVEIEEASPDALEFQHWVKEYIKEELNIDVDVVTRW